MCETSREGKSIIQMRFTREWWERFCAQSKEGKRAMVRAGVKTEWRYKDSSEPWEPSRVLSTN